MNDMAKQYPNVVRAVLEAPWAVQPSTLAAIIEMLELRTNGGHYTAEEIQARIGAGPPRRDSQRSGAVAVIPIYGVITPRADMLTDMSGGTPVERLRSAFLAAVDDKSVSSILLDVNSPGGQTDMIPEFAAEIRAARGKKPITAIANTRAASAAYWLASQADEFVVSPSASVGSIGVFAAHEDISARAEQEGVKVTLVSAGKYKTEASPFEPLTDEARAHIQERVDEAYGMFTSDVAKGRRVSVDTVRGGFGEGRMLTAKQALAEGMVDRVESFDQTITRLTTPKPQLATSGAVTNGSITISTGETTFQPVNAAFWDPPPQSTDDTASPQAADSGLSFAAELRQLLSSVEASVGTARSFADVRERDHLTGPKREQFEALADALGMFGAVRDDIVALLKDTDPEKPRIAAQVAIGEYLTRLANQGAER